MSSAYVHGYDPREAGRLQDQADTLAAQLHWDSLFPPGSRVLEAGCGVGAQTVTLARQNPASRFVSVDIAPASVRAAEAAVREAGLTNVEVQQGDILALPFAPGSFDAVFVCFVLEHLADPAAALAGLAALLRPGGTMTVIEGDHGSTLFHPDSAAARAAIACQVELQRRAGGDALIGRRVHPLLAQAGLRDVRVSPRLVYVDAGRPGLQEGFIRRTFTAMVAGVRGAALEAGLATAEAFDAGIRDLHRTAADDGVFCYTFFKGVGVAGGPGQEAAPLIPP